MTVHLRPGLGIQDAGALVEVEHPVVEFLVGVVHVAQPWDFFLETEPGANLVRSHEILAALLTELLGATCE